MSTHSLPVALCLALLSSFWQPALSQSQEAPEPLDIVLVGGTIHPGDGTDPVTGYVAVRDKQIAEIGEGQAPEALVTIDCRGLVIAPGFIDLHNHSDSPILDKKTRGNVNYLLQGCTTIVTGNCGSGPVDVGKYLDAVDRNGAGTHVAHLLPQGSLRSQVMGRSSRRPNEQELAAMLDLADKAMLDGAFGMSTGLIYVPGTFTETSELIALAKVVARHGGIYASHIRNEGSDLLTSIDEAIEIGRTAGLPVHVSHLKASGKLNWGALRLAIERVERAREEGLAVTADQYPYPASSTSLEATLLPAWSRDGGRPQLQQRLNDPETASRIREAVDRKLKDSNRIQLVSCSYRRQWIGKSIEEIARAENVEPADLVLEIERNGGAGVVNFGMSEDDVRLAMPVAWVATASDGGAKVPDSSQPHPRSFGTFPRKIGRYCVELDVLPLTAAIRSASGLPAEILGLTDRGLLKPRMAADIAVFDPATFRDRATYDEPYLPAVGMRYVLVEGTFAVYDGQATGALAGRALRK